jgi:kynurenine formamidase
MPGWTDGTILGQRVRIFDLEQPRFQGMPIHDSHQPGYAYFLHRRHTDPNTLDGPRTGSSGVVLTMEHAGTHIDALSHQADNQTLYGGVRVDESLSVRGYHRHGVEEIAPIVAPGVLLDVAGHRGETLQSGEVITLEELRDCAEQQGVSIQPGMVVLVRTGNGARWNDPGSYLPGPGVAGPASLWLAEQQVFAVGADNMAWDLIGLRDEDAGCELPGHLYLLARAGIYIIENLALEDLADAGIREFTFVCTPLQLVGATGSPVRPLAIVARD